MAATEIDLAYDRATAITYRDDAGRVPTAATVYLEQPDGTIAATVTASISATSTTIGSGSTTDALVLTSASGLAVGDWIAVTDDGITEVAQIVRLDGSTAHLLAAIECALPSGAAVKRLAVTASIPAQGLSAIGAGYRLRWELTISSAVESVVWSAAVVRTPFVGPCSARSARELVAQKYGATPAWGVCQQMAERANRLVRSDLARVQRRAYLQIPDSALVEAGHRALLYVAMDFGYRDRSDPQEEFTRRRAMDEALATLRSGLSDYDASGTGDTTQGTRWPMAARLTR